ncbi:MAG: hypothetical protein KGI93_05710 [Acidobacteriota bacterium]|nr:hypothetical protein [Acidobacteriota bacterium]MDE3191106.1 hypothetical protein [Acidobacteriota bacterium]
MGATLVAKLAVAVALGFSAGFFARAGEALSAGAAPVRGAGSFGGPVSHAGSIDWNLARAPGAPLRRVRCSGDVASGTSCFVGR